MPGVSAGAQQTLAADDDEQCAGFVD